MPPVKFCVNSVLLVYYRTATLCAAVRNCILRGTLLLMFIAYISLHYACLETGGDRASFTDSSNYCPLLTDFDKQAVTLISGPRGLGSFSNHSFETVLYNYHVTPFLVEQSASIHEQIGHLRFLCSRWHAKA